MGEGDWHPCGNFFIIHFQISSLLGANQLQDTDLSDEEGGDKDEIVTNQSTPRVGIFYLATEWVYSVYQKVYLMASLIRKQTSENKHDSPLQCIIPYCFKFDKNKQQSRGVPQNACITLSVKNLEKYLCNTEKFVF